MLRLGLNISRRAGGGLSARIGSGFVITGTELTCTVSGLQGGETVTYQWTDDGVNITGATSSTYTAAIGTDSVADASLIQCVATVDGEPITSNARTIAYAAGSVTESALADWTVDDDVLNVSFVSDFTTTNLSGDYVITGLPTGAVDDGDGTVSGTATGAAGTYPFTVTFTDQYERQIVGSYTVDTVYRAQATGGADLDLAFTVGEAITPTDLTANWTTNGNTLTWAITGTALPAGLAVDSAGELTGTPTAITADATKTLRGTDEYGRTTDDTFTLEVTEVTGFNPITELFGSSEQGAVLRTSATTCYTDTAGTTLATWGESVARINDVSGNGHHATQPDPTKRLILGRVPEGGRRNELVSTDTLATQSVTVTAAERTVSFKGTGTVTLSGASTAGPLVGTGADDRVTLTFTPSAGTLTLTVSGSVTEGQLELGASETAYQTVGDDQYDITEAGKADRPYLEWGGSDCAYTPAIDFTGTDKMSVFVAVEKASESDAGMVVEFGNNGTLDGSMFVVANGSSGSVDWSSGARGDAANATDQRAETDDAQASIVQITTLHDISGDSTILRLDGVQIDEGTGDKGAGNFGNHVLNIGARDASGTPSLEFTGKMFGDFILRGALTSGQTLTDTEAYMAEQLP